MTHSVAETQVVCQQSNKKACSVNVTGCDHHNDSNIMNVRTGESHWHTLADVLHVERSLHAGSLTRRLQIIYVVNV